jgi:hypothetical protein
VKRFGGFSSLDPFPSREGAIGVERLCEAAVARSPRYPHAGLMRLPTERKTRGATEGTPVQARVAA